MRGTLARGASLRRLTAGERVGDRLVVRGVLGTGASATVYAAEHLEVGHDVAVKVVHGVGGHEPHHLARFHREARICGRVRSPHVPQIYDVGRLPDGSPYLVMERLVGATLEARILRGPLPLPLVFTVAEQLLRALEATHQNRAVHRDVKPENVVLTRDDSNRLVVKLVDFGISKDLEEPGHLTMDGMVLGTPHYMAPEQVEGGALDERVDLYAAGAVIYEMLTARTPFHGASADAVMAAVTRDPIIPPGVLRDECPAALDHLVMRAMSRLPEDRFASAREMRERLVQIRQDHERVSSPTPLVVRKADAQGAGAPPPSLGSVGGPALIRGPAAALEDPGASSTWRRRRREGAGRWLLAALATAGVLGAVVAAAFVAGPREPGEGPRAATGVPAPTTGAPAAPTGARAQAGDRALAQRMRDTLGDDAREELRGERVDGPALAAAAPTADGAPGPDVPARDGEPAEAPGEGDDAKPDADPSRGDERRAGRLEQARAHRAPVTTVLPARRSLEEVRAQIREQVRAAMLRDPWQEEQDGHVEWAEPAADAPIVRDNPYADLPPNPFGAMEETP